MGASAASAVLTFLSDLSVIMSDFTGLSPDPFVTSKSSLSFASSVDLLVMDDDLLADSKHIVFSTTHYSYRPLSFARLLVIATRVPIFSTVAFYYSPYVGDGQTCSFFSSDSFFSYFVRSWGIVGVPFKILFTVRVYSGLHTLWGEISGFCALFYNIFRVVRLYRAALSQNETTMTR